MAYPGRPRGPQPNGSQRPFFRPPRMGNTFGFEQNSQQQGMGNGQRFPRPPADEPPREERPPSPDPYKKGGKFYRPSSATLSDTDSDREKEHEALRIRLMAMENDLRKAAEDKQKMEAEIQRLQAQSQRPPPRANADARTQEQESTRDFVYQWSNGQQPRVPQPQPQPQRPPQPLPQQRQNLDNTQSTMTGLANRFQTMTVSPATQVLQQLGVQVQVNKSYQPTARMHLAPAEEQHIKVMSDQIDTKAENVQLSASLIAAMEKMQRVTNADFSAEIEEIKTNTAYAVDKLLTQKQQITQVQTLANKFKVTVPMPIVEPEPYGFVRDRHAFDLKNIHNRVPQFDPDKNPDQCFALFMQELNDIAEGQYLQEYHWIVMFQNLLRGEARKEFNECRANKCTLNETVEYLGQLFTSNKTIEDDKRELEAFARKPQEDLTRCMARYSGKIRRIQHLYDPIAFPAIQEARMLTGLFALISQKTKAYLETESCKATIAGAPFKLESLIQMAHTYEKSYNEVPTQTLTCGTNSVDLQRKVASQAATIKTLQSENSKNADVTKQLGDLIQVASATFKRERSAERRSTSSKPAYRGSSKDRPQKDSDVIMTDVSQAPKAAYSGNTDRADRPGRADNQDEKVRQLKQKLREEYEKKNKGNNPSYPPKSGSRSNSKDRARGRPTTPGPSQQQRSGSTSSQKSGGGYSRSTSASSDKEAGVTRVAVDITHKSNFMHCMVCDMKHPPYSEMCPVTGNR